MRRAKKQRLVEPGKLARKAERAPAVRAQAIEAFFLHCYAQIQLADMAVKTVEYKGFSVTKIRILGLAALAPGLTVGELVRHLRLTHQSVNEPLRDLISEGFIVAKIGVKDRRHKRLFATRKGSRTHIRHVQRLAKNFENAFRATGSTAATGVLEVYRRLAQPSDRKWIARALSVALGN